MGNTNIRIEFIEKLSIAASFEANNTYPYLFQLLGYRKLLAEQILRNNGKDEGLEDLYNNVNDKIKLVIGL